jgi:hypothetical protein
VLGLLQDILCAVLAAGAFVLWALMSALNGLVLAVGVLISGVIALLPDLPDTPSPPGGDILGFVAYLFPIGGVVAALLTFVALWVAFLAIRIPLRWAKAL